MALTTRYVSSSGTDTYANSTSALTPMSLSTALSNAVAGDLILIRAGTYSRSASDTPTNSGTSAQPIIFRAVDGNWAQITPSRTNGNGPLDTSGLPNIAYASGFQFDPGASKTNIILESLYITGTVNGTLVAHGARCQQINCAVSNSNAGNGSSARATALAGQAGRSINSDYTVGGSSAAAAVRISGAYSVLWGCRLTGTNATQLVDLATYGSICFCTFTSGIIGVNVTVGATSECLIAHNTAYGLTGSFFKLPNSSAATGVPALIGNMVTDSSRLCDSLYQPTGDLPILRVNNRTRDNTNADTGFTDWPVYGAITTDTGGAETDYTNAAGGDFRLISSSPGKAASIPSYLDCGALQRQEGGIIRTGLNGGFQ